MILHDLRCRHCGFVEREAQVRANRLGHCPKCLLGGRKITYEFWETVKTDVFGSPQMSDASGREHSSQREKERFMRSQGYEGCGDKVGGARRDHTLRGTGFSYAGQRTRRTQAEG